MNSLKRLLSLVTALSLSYSVVCAQESITNGSEPNLGINVVSRNGGEISTIYSGSPEGYAGGLYSDIDFSDIQFMVVFKWGDEGDDDETVYIFPNKDQSASSINSALQQNPALDDTTGQQNVLNNSNAEITTNMLLVYDNIYHENVILPGKTLTIPVTVSNSGSEAKQLISYIAQYDLNGRLTDLTQGDIITAMPNQTVTASVSDNFSVDTACTAKVFVWEKDTMAPVSDSITLTLQNQDYFSDTYSGAQTIGLDKDLCGVINTAADIDIVKFAPSVSGTYAVRLSSEAGTVMGLYDSGQNLLNSVTSADDGENNYLLYSLSAGQNYYLSFGGNADNSYRISPTLPENIASVVKNTGVSANFADPADYNVYEFTPSADGEYIITAVGTSNVKAKLYNSNYELIAASSNGDDDVSFRITGDMTEGQKYYVVVEQKNEQQTDLSYSLYVEEPFSLIAVE